MVIPMSSENSTQSQTAIDESCSHDAHKRPVCTTDGKVVALCNSCYIQHEKAGDLDFERDAEVFGYAY